MGRVINLKCEIMKRLGLIAAVIASSSLAVVAQEGLSQEGAGYNKHSLDSKQIHQSDVMWKKSVVRGVDLREKQNKPLFADGMEFSRLILDAVLEGVITPYASDSLDNGARLTVDEFRTAYVVPGATTVVEEEEETNLDDLGDDAWGGWDAEETPTDDGLGDVASNNLGGVDLNTAIFFEPRDLYQIEINEDVIFDNQRSVLVYDPQSITLYVPADHPDNVRGIQSPIATFSYRELVEKVFKDNPKAIWFNPYNDSEHRNLEDAFELRLFSSYLIKISNPSDEYLVDTYGGDPRVGIMASQWKAFEMLEYEHNLWEF